MPIFKLKQRRHILERLVVTLACLYLLSPFGATFNGVVIPDSHPITFGLILSALFLWGIARMRHSWRWHRSALDMAMPLWLLAIAAAMLANPGALRRSLIGLWFVAMYIAVWYIMQDWLANRPSAKELLVDGLLGAGLMVMVFSAVQILYSGKLLQPVSVMGNANALGTVLLVLIPLALRKAWRARAAKLRTLWRIYCAIAIINLALTLSRGAWISLFAAGAALFLLSLAHFGMLSPREFLAWWGKGGARRQRRALAAALAVSLCLICAAALIVHSFTLPERSANLRAAIWRSALLQFLDAPITGGGLFTYGKHSGRHLPIPPAQHYAHAHNLPLHVAAELGIIGLLALGATLSLIVKRLQRLWHQKTSTDRLDWIFFVAALVGFGIHHLFDVSAMMPAVALLGIVALVLALEPSPEQKTMSASFGKTWAIGLTLLWLGLLAIGYRDMQSNRRYIEALRLTATSKVPRIPGNPAPEFHQALDTLDELIASDPTMPVYHLQSALLWGLLAADGEQAAIQQAIAAFKRFLILEPNQAISWANLAELHWQAEDRWAAARAMERARELAPNLPLFSFKLHQYRTGSRLVPLTLPHNRYNQDMTRYQYLRESLPISLLPQVSWSVLQP